MGIGGISIWQLLIVFAIVVLLFGTRRLKNLGSDLGGAVKGFRKAFQDEGDAPESSSASVSAKETRRLNDFDSVTDSAELKQKSDRQE